MLAYHQSSNSVVDSTFTSELSGSLTAGAVLGVDFSQLAPLGSLSSRTVNTLRLVTTGTSGWTYNAKVTQTSSGNSVQLSVSPNGGGKITLGTYTLSSPVFYLRAIRNANLESQMDLCLANASGSCVASVHTLELPSASAPVLVETGVLEVSAAPSQCEAVHFSARGL